MNPSKDVMASQSGRFMSDDGRVAFATSDSLVEGDTNGLVDVYEFVGGRPQLISSGTAQADLLPGNHFYPGEYTGVESISRDGVDIFFSTYDTLAPDEDFNGQFTKFYDARTNGGFTPPQAHLPCVAADECHGDENPAPGTSPIRTTAPLGSSTEARPKGARSTRSITRNGRRRATSDATTPEGAGPMAERTDMSRVLATLAAAIAALALTWCFADQAHAVEEINEFDTHVSATQAGGHPDVDYKVTWTARNSSSRPCNCEDARRPRHAFPHRIHRRSTQRSRLQADRIRTPLMPRRSPRWGWSRFRALYGRRCSTSCLTTMRPA